MDNQCQPRQADYTRFPELLPEHYDMLRVSSGISDDVIRERGYRSVDEFTDLIPMGFAQGQRRVPGLLLPSWATDGWNGTYQYRPDNPRVNRDGDTIKYETPKKSGIRLDCPPRCRAALADPTVTLWITEGIKKADALASRGLCTIGLVGVWGFVGKNAHGAVTWLADWDYVALNERDVRIVFDSDVMTKKPVRDALDRLTEHLQRKGAHVVAVYLPAENGHKVGVDDYLVTHTVADLDALVEAPRPQPKAAPAMVELLESPPLALVKPLQLIEGRAYLSTWLWVKTTKTEELDKKGQIVRLDPPVVTTERRLFVLRDDGTLFGDGADRSLDELGLEVKLGDAPQDTKLLSVAGTKSYRAGVRPDPLDVFARLTGLVDRFMSFDRSLAPQSAMCELTACYALTTWFLEAFNVIGFLWPNGDRGSGKTKYGVLVCDVSYLGEVLLSGSSYACLRDLADMGATLLFDDAENLSDPKRTDPDKRNLLLAGNRRGAVVAVKEARPDGTWGTRLVNAYCPRLFTAIKLPDSVLGSRSIVVPLVRTADARKANAEVKDYAVWPCDRRKLVDDLWSLALGNLPALPAHEAVVNADAPLVGRNLEPWRPILAVAHWLDSLGATGLYERMTSLSKSYQTERVELETADLTRMVVRALIELVAPHAPHAPHAPLSGIGAPLEIAVSDITGKVNQIAIDDDVADPNGADFTNTDRVGRALSKLRIRKGPKTSGKGRTRITSLTEVDSLARSFGFSPILEDPTTTESSDAEESHLSIEVGQVGQPGQVGQADDDDVEVF